MDYKKEIVPYVTRMGEDRVRVEFWYGEAEYLTLYYEKAKKGFVNKPVGMDAWTCVEAKYSDGDLYSLFEGLTPRMMMEWGQELVRGLKD